MRTYKSYLFLVFVVVSCGGGGGGGGGDTPAPPPTPAPGVSFSASPTSVLLNNTSTFSWSTTNATSCTASGSNNWTGTKATSGTEDVSIDIAGNTVFTLSCSGGGGTRNASVTVEGFRQTDGVVVDGYISGADVFIDENENFIADGTENSTTSDNDGKFTIKYANGSLVSIGGTDLDSQTLLDNLLITHKLDGFSDFKAITPVTSVDAFLESIDINAALGIDSSINIAVDDPVALKGDSGIYDYLYEKGNQLTVLAYALQNITNDLNTTTETTQDFFKSIAEEVETEYTQTQVKVDIETEAFIAKALDNVINIKSLNIEETAKQNTLKALSGVLPIIEVKSSDDLTTSVIRFGVSTLQEDIKAIANGTADENKVASYTTDVIKYIAEDQGISSDEITPDITAIDDNSSTDEDTSIIINVLANDSFITTSPISIDASNGDNGTVGVTKSSPPQITYSPNSDYFGNDLFSYTITQGDKTSSAEVEVDINPINDVPSIDIASTLSIPENQTAIATVSVSDPDEDDLTLTLSGEDANSLNLTSENVLSFNDEPDFETKAAYSINLSLTDGEESVDKDITINITNVNDIAPEFTSEATFSAAENQTAIGTVTATDAEGDDVTFTVLGDGLAITSAGVLTFVNEPDFETKTSYTATVTATDGTNPTTQDITINITNVNDIAPEFTSEATFSAAENQTAIGTVTATDAEGDDVTFTVLGDGLAITSAGVLTFVNEPDFETKTSYTATVTATDGTNPTTQDITINITNVNDIAPEFTSEATFSAAENQTAIGTVTATDAEGDDVTFTVLGDDLAITSAGVLTFVNEPDFETKATYTATVTATDGTNPTTQDITVSVLDVDEIAPVLTVTGDNPATVELGASYTDAGATSDDGSTVKTTGTVDTNTVGSYTLTYSATDAAGNTGTATRTVNVVDTTAPVITVTGDNPATVELGASYTDAGATSDDGSTVKTTGTVDTNTVGSYTLTYSATDAAGNTGTATRTVTVQLPPPEFGLDGRAVKGVIGGGTITVVDSVGADVAIASGGSTNADGSYTIIFDQAEVSAPIVVTVAGGDGSTMVCDIDLAGTDDDCAVGDGTSVAFGESYPLPTTFALRGLVAEVPTEDGASATVNITPASDLATNLALASADTSSLTAAVVEDASSQVLDLIQTITGTDLSGQDLNDIAIPDVADSSDTAAASASSLALAAFSAAIIANQGEGETVGDVIARVNASLSVNTEGNLVGSGTDLSSLANSVVTALTTVSAQVTAGGGDSSAVDASIDTAEAIEETYESIGDEDVAVDTTAPIITITGANPITLERGTSYIEVGASADGGETVITSGTVNTSTVGIYKITYSASDGFNTGTATRTVNVVDTTDPVISVTGDNPATVELGATYTDAGAVAVDFGQSIDVSSSSTLDTSSVGSYKVTYSATDSSGNTSTVTRTINVVDTTKPLVIVNGVNPTIVELGDVYTDAGATTSDFGIVTLTEDSDVNSSVIGTYSVVYTATDASGNSAFATRTVLVVDTTAPVITVTGDNPATVELGATYTDAGATANSGETVTTSGTVDTSTVGTYTITYTSTDASGNTGTATRTVTVVDTTAPVITVTGDNPATVELGGTWTDAGATADDGSTVVTTGTVDTDTVGSYTVTYTSTDASGNTGTATRTVTVVDTTAPVVTVTSGTDTVELGGVWTDAGATADGDETVTTSGAVDTSTVGTYTLTYSATDTAGNTGTATRTVTVEDTTAPVVTVTSGTDTVELGGTWTDAGATATDLSGTVTVVTTGTVDTDTVGTYTVTYTSTDASGNAGTATRTVTVVDTTAPAFIGAGSKGGDYYYYDTVGYGGDFQIPEELAIGTVFGFVKATDANTVTYSINKSFQEGSLININPTSGELSLLEVPDVESSSQPASYGAIVIASDGVNTGEMYFAIEKININDNTPNFTSLNSFSAAENQTFAGTLIVEDLDGLKNDSRNKNINDVSITISGSDFELGALIETSNGSTGIYSAPISFKTAPDYETKSSYTATVTASDGTNAATQDITVNVTDLNERPTFTSLAFFNASENQKVIGQVIASDVDGDNLTFTVSGSDLEISQTGALTFVNTPDYETKSTYEAEVTITDGLLVASQSITVYVLDISEGSSNPALTFSGKAIDGYIAYASIFIDQNFNFKYDDGEYITTSDINGEFAISVNTESEYQCLINRPIVANVPVGAVDSSLGVVEKAYQMVLPSINDTGSSSIIISPFTSLFSKAILDSKSNINQDLTVEEGCQGAGNSIASNISSEIDTLKQSIETNFGITFSDLTSDFISSSGDKVNETAAQNIAKIFPYLQSIDNQVSESLTAKFDKEIRANVSLSEDALDIIFSDQAYDKLPLDFSSIYRTNANSANWYQEERLEASGAFISDDGILSRADCSLTDTELCNISELTLKNISNASTSYLRTSNFYNNTIDFNDINVTSGTLYVNASDARTWRNDSANWQQKNNRDRECQSDNQIRFQNSVIAGTKTEFQYSSYSQGYQKSDCDLVRHYYFPILRTQTFIDNIAGNSLELSYYIPDITRSGVSDNLPYDFISNRLTIDPTQVIKDIAALPRTLKELDEIRELFNERDYVLFTYHKDSETNAYFEVGTNPRNDMFWDYASNNDDRLYGQPAREAFFNRISAEPAFSSDIYGASLPTNSKVLGRIANSYIEVVDYDGNSEIKIPVYPSYDVNTKTLDYSISGSSLTLKNVQDFISKGIDTKPVSVNMWYNPDDSISKTVPIKLYLYKGDDTNIDEGEGYFSIEFALDVNSSEADQDIDNIRRRSASQTWKVLANSTILVKYTEGSVTLSKEITNYDLDQIVLTDGREGDLSANKLLQPSSLSTKILSLISNVSSNIDGIQSFFTNNGTYTLKMDLASGGHSLIGYERNTIDYITGTFQTATSPSYAISVNDISLNEGETSNLCFYRPSEGNTDATSFDLSFTQRERPGKGALADDFSLSSSSVTFADGDIESCISVTANEDTHFDWIHDAYLDISQPSNGQALSRSRVKISILDSYGYLNRISWKAR